MYAGSALGSGSLLVQATVAEIEEGVDGHHDQIQNVEIEDDIVAVKDLVGDATDVADNNGPLESKAFAGGGAAFQGLENVAGPGKTEGNQHTDFKNTHGRSSNASKDFNASLMPFC